MGSQLQYGIEACSRLCLKNFERLLECIRNPPTGKQVELSQRSVENDVGRFKIWCGNLGALQTGGSSLDVRLRDSPVVRGTVVTFLTQMNESLEQCMPLIFLRFGSEDSTF